MFRDWYFDFLQSSCARRLAEFLAKAAPLRPTTGAAAAAQNSSSASTPSSVAAAASPHLSPKGAPSWICDALLDDPVGPTRRVLERYLEGLDQCCGLQLRDLLGCANESQLNPENDHPTPARRTNISRRSSVIATKVLDGTNPAASFRAAVVRARDVLRPRVPPPTPPTLPASAPASQPPSPPVKASPVSPKDAIFARLNASKAAKKAAAASGTVPSAAPQNETSSGANGNLGATTATSAAAAATTSAAEEQPGGDLEEAVAALAHLHHKCQPAACSGLDLAKAIGKVSDPVTQAAYGSVHEDAASFLASVQELHDAAVARKRERLNALRAHLTGNGGYGDGYSGPGSKIGSRQKRRGGSRSLLPTEGESLPDDDNDNDESFTSPLSASAVSPMYSTASQEPPFRPMLKHSASVDYFPTNCNGSFSSSIDHGSMDSFREKKNGDSAGDTTTNATTTSGIRPGLTRAYRRNSTSNMNTKSSSSGSRGGRSRRNSTSAQLAKQIARLRRFRPNSFRVPMSQVSPSGGSKSSSGAASSASRRISPAVLNKDKYRVGPGHVPPSVRWRRAYKKVTSSRRAAGISAFCRAAAHSFYIFCD